jgi:hypothetical protein
MYTDGEEESNLQLFSTHGAALPPGGTIEAEIEADGSIFDEAEYQGPSGESAGQYFDYLGFDIDAIATAFDVELTPFILAYELASDCDVMPSTFSFVAATEEGGAASSEAWVLTAENCRYGCPHEHLISAAVALGFQSPGEDGSEIWSGQSDGILEALAGFWVSGSSDRGKVVQDDGLHFNWREFNSEAWEVSVGEGSKAAGYSG